MPPAQSCFGAIYVFPCYGSKLQLLSIEWSELEGDSMGIAIMHFKRNLACRQALWNLLAFGVDSLGT